MGKIELKLFIVCLTLVFIFSTKTIANSQSEAFNKGINYAVSVKDKPANILRTFKQETAIKNYTDHPEEISLLEAPDNIVAKAKQSIDKDETEKIVKTGIDSRKEKFNYSKGANSPFIKTILKKADSMIDVATGQFKDCTKQTSCTISYETHQCEETPKNVYQYCRKNLNVDLIPHELDNHYYLTAHLSVGRDHNYAGVNVNVVTGKVSFLGPHDATFNLEGRLPSGVDCTRLQGKISSKETNARLDYLSFPSCNNNLTLDFHISGGHNMDIKIDIVSSKVTYEQQERWNDECSGLANTSSCSFQEEHCVSPAATRDIQGFSITKECWSKQASYFCGVNSGVDTCETYREQSCEQIKSVCKNKNDSGCTQYQETYRCPTKQCTDTGMLCNGQAYCLSGDCVKKNKQADPDFQRSITSLAAVSEASKSYNANHDAEFPIFGGKVKTCNRDFLNFADCCSDDGWGVDLHLGQCDADAKELGEAKEKGLTTFIDSKDEDTLGLVSHQKRYCVFPSKLARIIQESGRRNQLHVSFGNFDNPDCRGLTLTEFSQLKLNKINFNEVFSEISQTFKEEDHGNVNQRANVMAKTWAERKTPHG
jgi:conjugal transfer mating pair stabilization protein TraN